MRTLVALTSVFTISLTSCGDDPRDDRPVEILYFVQGPSGTPFEVVAQGDNGDCLAQSRDQLTGLITSRGYGFQSTDATHVLPGTFQAPHYFVFENERQPTRAVFRNLGQLPLTVLQMRGLAPPASTLVTQIIPPGQCRSVSTFDDKTEMEGGNAGPENFANDYRVEVCSFERGTDLPSGFVCQDLAPRGQMIELDANGMPLRDIGAAFLSTVGDLESSFLTRCLQLENSEQVECKTPATFYMFNPQDLIGVAMTRLSGQTNSFLQVDLYRGNQLLDTNRGTGDVFVRDDL